MQIKYVWQVNNYICSYNIIIYWYRVSTVVDDNRFCEKITITLLKINENKI